MLRIAHVSDLHVLSLLRAEWRQFLFNGTLDAICAGGASLDHPRERIRAGFNLYTMQDDGHVSSAEAWVLDPVGIECCRRELLATGESA